MISAAEILLSGYMNAFPSGYVLMGGYFIIMTVIPSVYLLGFPLLKLSTVDFYRFKTRCELPIYTVYFFTEAKYTIF